MKKCIKCDTKHNNSGNFCSRSCSNSRVRTEETKEKIRNSLIGRKTTRNISPERLEQWKEKIASSRLKKYLDTPFDDLGLINKRRRVFEEQGYRCNRCALDKWQGYKISLELEHKDGNNQNNARENLEGLCPNCHSVTETWRGRNKSSQKISDDDLLSILESAESIRQGLIKAGVSPRGSNYQRAKNLLENKPI